MKNKFYDPNIPIKNKSEANFQLIEGTNIPLPSEVEINESGTCNRKCSFVRSSQIGLIKRVY